VARQIIINSTPQEARVAVMENARLTEIFIERKRGQGIVGSIYKGRITRVLPGMQAAFVDIGLPKAAYLHASDVFAPSDEEDDAGHEDFRSRDVDEVTHPPAESDSQAPPDAAESTPRLPLPAIEERLQKGQDLIVQIAKEPIGTKGARVTSNVAIPGRYMVLLPLDHHLGISRRIADAAERDRLLQAVASVRPNSGVIIRTASEGVSKRDIQADLRFLRKLWRRITKNAATVPAPALLHSDLDVILRTIRDLFTTEVTRVVMDNRRDHQRVLEFMEMVLPNWRRRVELYEHPEPVFERYGIEAQIAKALERKVWLKSGGYLVIDHTEALTSIDVNTGRYVGKTGQEETALHTNLEATRVVIDQLRLRHIGGLIVIDFIDMEKPEHRRQVMSALAEAVKSDKAHTNILGISELGLVEMTRQRTRESLVQRLCEPCAVCAGKGWVKSTATIAHEILRRIRREAVMNAPLQRVVVTLHPTVAAFLRREDPVGVRELEEELRVEIVFHQASHLAADQYEVTAVASAPPPSA